MVTARCSGFAGGARSRAQSRLQACRVSLSSVPFLSLAPCFRRSLSIQIAGQRLGGRLTGRIGVVLQVSGLRTSATSSLYLLKWVSVGCHVCALPCSCPGALSSCKLTPPNILLSPRPRHANVPSLAHPRPLLVCHQIPTSAPARYQK